MGRIKNKEFHNNGKLAYEETIAILDESKEHLYDRRLKSPKGYCYIRVGKLAKHFDNGQLAWVLNFNDKGEVVKENNASYRKDGTIIQY